jgi:hypothetical protein
MSAVAFDTLKFAGRLESGGFTPQQARAAAEAFADATGQELVTRADLKAELAETKADLLKSIVGMLVVAATVNAALVIGAMFGLAKLLGH